MYEIRYTNGLSGGEVSHSNNITPTKTRVTFIPVLRVFPRYEISILVPPDLWAGLTSHRTGQ